MRLLQGRERSVRVSFRRREGAVEVAAAKVAPRIFPKPSLVEGERTIVAHRPPLKHGIRAESIESRTSLVSSGEFARFLVERGRSVPPRVSRRARGF